MRPIASLSRSSSVRRSTSEEAMAPTPFSPSKQHSRRKATHGIHSRARFGHRFVYAGPGRGRYWRGGSDCTISCPAGATGEPNSPTEFYHISGIDDGTSHVRAPWTRAPALWRKTRLAGPQVWSNVGLVLEDAWKVFVTW